MHTEKEAATLWCPHVRAHIEITGHGNRIYDGPKDDDLGVGCTCIGSQCMAWRWNQIAVGSNPKHETVEKRGYCGISGAPSQ